MRRRPCVSSCFSSRQSANHLPGRNTAKNGFVIPLQEGAAYDILKSGEGFLREHRPLVVVELDSAIGRTVWPPVLPVAPISGGENQHEKIRPGSIGAAVVDFLSGRTSSSSSGGSGLGYAKFTALEDYQDEGSQEAHEFVAWQVGLLKTLKLGVWTAIFYDAVRWDRRYSRLVRELPFEHLERGSSEPEGENEAALMAEKEFWIALDAHFPAASTLENGGALDRGTNGEVDKKLFLDRLHILCARECLRTVNEASCRCFDVDGREGGSCRLFSSCAGFEGVEPLIALDEGEGAGHKFIPKMPKMGTLSAWGGGEEVEELSHFRAMELDNDLVAWPAPHRHSSSSHRSEEDL